MRAATVAVLLFVTIMATPAQARAHYGEEADLARTTRTLNDPRTQDATAGVMVALTDSLLDLRIDRLRAAMARIDPESAREMSEEGPHSLRDVVTRNDPDFEQHLYRDSRRATAQLGTAASGMAAMLPELRAMGARMGQQIEDAAKRFPTE